MPSSDDKKATVVPVSNEGELLQALAIREVVFIEEQHVPAGIDRDAEDARAFHILAFQGGHAVGTGRLVMLSHAPHGETGQWAQVGRMAVLQAHRKGGIGSKILAVLEDQARRNNVVGIRLHAQLSSIDFYKKHGYQPVGAAFQEGGMPHLEMHKKLGPKV
jgi:predicted GNAT family N-acyltransferase